MSVGTVKIPKEYSDIVRRLSKSPVIRAKVPVGRNPLSPIARPYRNETFGTVIVREVRFEIKKELKHHLLVEVLE